MASHDENHGPFIQGNDKPGLLARLLGRGGNDPSAPHSHREASTSSMHRTATGRPDGASTQLPKWNELPTPRRRRPLLTILGAIFSTLGVRGTIAIVILVVALANSGVMSFVDAIDDGAEPAVSTPLPDLPTPVPATPVTPSTSTPPDRGTTPTGTSVGQIVDVAGASVRVDIAGGGSRTFVVRDSGVRDALRRHVGDQAVLEWNDTAGTPVVVGVVAPGTIVRAGK